MAETPPPGAPAADPAARIAALFTRADGSFRFARWGRPLAPMVYGTNDEGIGIVEAALGEVAGLGGLRLAGTDPELGANFLVFFCRDWAELPQVPGLGRMIPELADLVARLAGAGANQYRLFGFDGAGAIRFCITLIRYDAELQRVPAQALALGQCLQGLLLWSERAFAAESPIAIAPGGGQAVVKPWYRALIGAAYDAAIPVASAEPALVLRLAARVALAGDAMGDAAG
jgi:hypothetical protein